MSGRVGAVVFDADGRDAGEQEAGAGVVAAAAAAAVGSADAGAVADYVALIEKTFICNRRSAKCECYALYTHK